MDEKQNNSSLRRYNLIQNLDEQKTRINNNNLNHQQQQQILPISIDHHHLSTTTSEIISTNNKRRRSSITTNEQLLSSSNNQDFIYNQNISLENRKRSAQDDIITYTTHHFLREHEQYNHKRARYEHSNTIELENQPPKRHSLIFQEQEQDLLSSSTWNYFRHTNEMPLIFNDIIPSLTHSTSYHRTTNNSEHYSPLITEQHHHSSIFSNNSIITSNSKSTISKANMRLLSSSSPLRTTNFTFDNKQSPTIIRTGNISPAHSDSSSESTSTCSSDEQLHHHHYHHFHQPQPWRSYRERENYEQLLDLAEKLSDPNRFNKVDIQQFFSYRYKIKTLSSKQTACVICMSHFKNGQHIRVLPCQHEYHSKCIARWFTMNSSCPICRRDNFLSSC